MSRQRKYVIDLLQEIGMLQVKPTKTPLDPNISWDINTSPPYLIKNCIDSLWELIYLVVPQAEISDVMGLVCRYVNKHRQYQWETLCHIL